MKIESFAKFLIKSAREYGTSDIHVLPNKVKYGIYFRLSGRMALQYSIDEEEGTRLISYFKYLANLDVGEKRKPQSGSLYYEYRIDAYQDLRLSTITNYQGKESLVIRLLETQDETTLEKSTLLPQELNLMKRLIAYKSGLILFSGPVNSGKTTTMYQLVRNLMKNSNMQVISIEDPVEIEEDKFLQIQVNEKAGNTYETSLKASLRHHPDVIIVGEIRDEETAKMAIRGALTGHLIIASVHAKNAEGVLSRMSELGISLELLQQTILAIVFQKLLPLYCALCEDNCLVYCTHHPINNKRAALYDVLTSKDIQQSNIENIKRLSVSRPRNFNHLLKKVFSYGFISEEVYEQYYIP
ncbi:MAG TPA: competence type IV pilus ATPase ComGA [Atopostipes sp.]|nr:competence type IV pilus ATPase ComGA [Atopostipes sp.]